MKYLLITMLAVFTIVLLDSTMRRDQMQMCLTGDAVTCPEGLWIWSEL